jgi:hypothetical protein
MSIYSALSTNAPVITYSALHQAKKGIEPKEYIKTLQEMHKMVRTESQKVAESWKIFLQEASASSVQTVRGTLSQFLTLPLDTDVKEIHRILGDQFAHLLKQTLPNTKVGVIASTEGRFVWEREQNTVLQALHTRGREYLKKLKFKVTESSPDIFESDFVIEGGLNLDIIEHIVRDRMGIYGTAHGRHTEESDTFVFAAHNLVYHQGSLEQGDVKYEAAIHFTKGKPQYDPFRKELAELLDAIQSEFQFGHISMWQRKLGLGAGTEFNIRARTNDRKMIKEAILAIAKGQGKDLVRDPLIKQGKMLIREIIR